jgi:hypothetical protein
MLGRQSDRAERGAERERFLESDPQPVLVAAGDEAHARRRADGGVRVGLDEPDAARREAVDVGRLKVGTPVACDVGVAHVVGQDEHDVRRTARGLA